MADFTPRIYGKYYLIDRIAVGGMAEVYAAKSFSEAGFEKMLVIKRILSRYSENRSFVSMFIDEAKISVALQHANVVQVYDFGKIKDNYYLAMEWVDGRDLKRLSGRLKERRESLPQDFAVYIAHEICKGLDYAHKLRDYRGESMGIVHQDISPSNVVVAFNGEIKVVDFGIAKTQALTNDVKDGINWGKVQYVAPERLRNQEPTPRSDIFSVGVVLHEMLTGRGLFRDRDPKASARRILSGDYPAPSIYNPAVPPGLDLLVMRALALKPDDRFQDAGELQEMLFEFLGRSPAGVQRNLAEYMGEVFADERKEQQERMERGSRMALDFHESLGDVMSLDSNTSGSVPLGSGLLEQLGSNPHADRKSRNLKDLARSAPSNATLEVDDLSEPISESLGLEESRDLPSSGSGGRYTSTPSAPAYQPSAPARKRAAHVHGVRKPSRPEPESPPSSALWLGAIGVGLLVGLAFGLFWLRGSEDTLPAADVVAALRSELPEASDAEGLRVSEGWIQLRKGSQEALVGARKAFEEAVAADGESVSALAGLALVYAELSERQPELGPRARTLLARAEAVDPSAPELLRGRAGTLVAFGQLDGAVEAAQACLVVRPDDALCALFEGLALQRHGDLVQAEARLLTAREALQESGPALRGLAAVYVEQGRLREARELLEGFPLRARHPAIDGDLAELYARAGAYDRALELAESSLDGDPRGLRARLLKAELLLHVYDDDEAADGLLSELAEESIGDEQLSLRVLVQASNAALAAGDPARAERLSDSAVKARFGWAPAHYAQARARAARGERAGAAEALTHVDQDSVSGRTRVRYHYGAAMLLLDDERLRIAEMELEAALALEPGFWWARVALAEVRRRLGKPDEAAELLEQSWQHDLEQEFVRDLRVLVVVPEPPFPGHEGASCLLRLACQGEPGMSAPWLLRIALARGSVEGLGSLPPETAFAAALSLVGGAEELPDQPGLYRRRAQSLLEGYPSQALKAARRAQGLDPADAWSTALLLGLPTP